MIVLLNVSQTLLLKWKGDYTYKLTYFLGADMKFLAMALGIAAANSTYSCIWCKCPSRDRHDITKEWSVTNTGNGGTRTVSQIQECVQIKKRKITEDVWLHKPAYFPMHTNHNGHPRYFASLSNITNLLI